MPSSPSGICKALHKRRHSPAQTAKQRAQENEAWRIVRTNAASILQQVQPGASEPITAVVLQPSFYESQERWIALQLLVSWRAVICSQPLRANADFSTLTIQQGIPISDIEEHSRPADLKKACWLFWIELCGEPFTDAIFRDLQRSA